ncbi:MAG: NADH dehydrogenase ubiquinone Fe-S protein 4, partial [Pseudomonadota bacterium]
EQREARRIDPLMGWTSSSDTQAGQVRLSFETKEDAIAYAKANKLPHQVMEQEETQPVIKSYADNFSHRRRIPWTH